MTLDEAVAVLDLAGQMSIQTALDLAMGLGHPTPAFDEAGAKLNKLLTEIVMRDAGGSQ